MPHRPRPSNSPVAGSGMVDWLLTKLLMNELPFAPDPEMSFMTQIVAWGANVADTFAPPELVNLASWFAAAQNPPGPGATEQAISLICTLVPLCESSTPLIKAAPAVT